MNYITNKPPRSVTINGVEYPINTDFRAVFLYNEIIEEEKAESLPEALMSMYGTIPGDIAGAVGALNDFIQMKDGTQKKKRKKPSKKILGINNEKAMDFRQDSALIWSAFRRVYGIDLREITYLHWWDFQHLLAELPDDVRLSRIMSIRTKRVDQKKLGSEASAQIKELQRVYKLEEPETERERLLKEALMNGEDPTPYL